MDKKNQLNQKLTERVAELEKLVEQQAKMIAAQSVRIAELEKRLNKNSSNSSKPPSSDGLSKTNNLIRRVYEHKNKMVDGFTKQYNVDRLVYYEAYSEIYDAITREKQIKKWSRKKKNDLINQMNPQWEDLYETLL